MDGSRKYYAKWNKSDTERQIPHHLTYMWNQKERIKQNKNREKWVAAQQSGDWEGERKQLKEIKRSTQPVI